MDPHFPGHTRDQKHDSESRILIDLRPFCVGYPKLNIKSNNNSTDTDHTTIIMDLRHRGNTREQNHDSRARILRDPQGFWLGHPKLTIKSHNKSKGSGHNTVIMDPHHLGHTRE